MPIEVQNEFFANGTVRVWAYVYDNAKTPSVLVDPTTITITIKKAGTAVVTAQAMTKSEVGEYYYDYTPTVAASYTELVTVTDGAGEGAKVSHGTGSFKVKTAP